MDRERPYSGDRQELWQDEVESPSENYREQVAKYAEMIGKPPPREGLSAADLKEYHEFLKIAADNQKRELK